VSEDDIALEDRELFPPPTAPLEVARRVYHAHRDQGHRTLLCWRGGWMRWNRSHWSEIDAAALRSSVYEILGDAAYEAKVKVAGVVVEERRPWNPDKRKVANVIEAMAAVGHLDADVDPPAWIGLHSAAETPAGQMISCRNGLLNLAHRTLTKHSPALFNVVSVPFDYLPDAGEPTVWKDFLTSVWGEDQQSVQLLQEYLGYVLSGRTDMQKLLLLIGPTRSGKGTIARMLTELVGRLQVAGPTLASLGTNFGLSPLLGKPLAIISDARLGDTPTHTVVERLLSITGEDMLTVDRKFRDPWSGKLPTRFVVLSNELPRFKDSSGAIANRLLILQMTESFLGREDRTLDARLAAELPAILLWALEGLARLTANGRFTVPASSRDAAALMMDLASPVSAFVRDRCDRGPDLSVTVDDLYAAWKSWAIDNGHQPGAKSTFGRNLRASVPNLKVSQTVTGDMRVRQYNGITVRSSSGHNAFLPVHPVQDGADRGDQHRRTGSSRADSAAKPQVNSDRTGCTGRNALQRQLTQFACPDCGDPVPAGHVRCQDCFRDRRRR